MQVRKLRATVSTIVTILVVLIAIYTYFQNSNQAALEATQPPPPPPSITAPVAAAAPPSVTRPVTVPPSVTRPVTAAPPSPSAAARAKFDFYVLALSWAPEFCVENNNQDPQECSTGKKLGFVLHGLWPQYNRGYPENCSTQKLPADVKNSFPGLYPTSSLYNHEWEKHGTCSGLGPEEYLATTKRIKDSLIIPAAYRAPEQQLRITKAQLVKDLTAANPGLTDPMVAPICSGSSRYLSELQVCFSPDGKPVACSSEVQNDSSRSCAQGDVIIRNVR